jgi:hypothetical protein
VWRVVAAWVRRQWGWRFVVAGDGGAVEEGGAVGSAKAVGHSNSTIGVAVDSIITPIVAIPFGKPSFDEALILTINDSQIRFGAFLTAVDSFLAIAFTVFWMLKAYNRITGGGTPAGPMS